MNTSFPVGIVRYLTEVGALVDGYLDSTLKREIHGLILANGQDFHTVDEDMKLSSLSVYPRPDGGYDVSPLQIIEILRQAGYTIGKLNDASDAYQRRIDDLQRNIDTPWLVQNGNLFASVLHYVRVAFSDVSREGVIFIAHVLWAKCLGMYMSRKPLSFDLYDELIKKAALITKNAKFVWVKKHTNKPLSHFGIDHTQFDKEEQYRKSLQPDREERPRKSLQPDASEKQPSQVSSRANTPQLLPSYSRSEHSRQESVFSFPKHDSPYPKNLFSPPEYDNPYAKSPFSFPDHESPYSKSPFTPAYQPNYDEDEDRDLALALRNSEQENYARTRQEKSQSSFCDKSLAEDRLEHLKVCVNIMACAIGTDPKFDAITRYLNQKEFFKEVCARFRIKVPYNSVDDIFTVFYKNLISLRTNDPEVLEGLARIQADLGLQKDRLTVNAIALSRSSDSRAQAMYRILMEFADMTCLISHFILCMKSGNMSSLLDIDKTIIGKLNQYAPDELELLMN